MGGRPRLHAGAARRRSPGGGPAGGPWGVGRHGERRRPTSGAGRCHGPGEAIRRPRHGRGQRAAGTPVPPARGLEAAQGLGRLGAGGTVRSAARLGDRGSVTVHAIAVGVVLSLFAAVVLQAALLVRMKHRVAGAADLAALAGATASLAGEDGCRAARDVARRNGAALSRCRMDLDVATVTARLVSDSWWERRWATEVESRAAPADYVAP
ncbi:MAG: hypothetical protein EON52_02385 [Actinomycetales bacterium]|nr:MAG: hypothetical protein EON52_02385 [Actinomycetales bacterium]